VHSYDTAGRGGHRLTLHHADVYRLEQFAEVAELAFGELAEFDGIVLVEWGDVVAGVLGEHLEVRLDLDDHDEGTRRITLSAAGATWARRWSGLSLAVGRLELPSW
jgi:tRNA threonylcarbamoyladenosine biosynthesis protein TsaE